MRNGDEGNGKDKDKNGSKKLMLVSSLAALLVIFASVVGLYYELRSDVNTNTRQIHEHSDLFKRTLLPLVADGLRRNKEQALVP